MKEKARKGLLTIWSDVEPDYRVEFQKWHNCEHIMERVSIQWFTVGRRYRGVGNAPDFLMCYETDDSHVLSSKPYLHAVNHPSPWTQEMIRHSKNIVRAIYSMIAYHGEGPPMEAPYIALLKFNIESGREKEFLLWYEKEQLPSICRMPDVYRGRLYRVDVEISLIKTEERKIHRGGPAHQQFLTLYEIASPDVPDRKGWEDLHRDVEHGKRIEDFRYESYWLDFVMYGPASSR
jgi:hypothetical protein